MTEVGVRCVDVFPRLSPPPEATSVSALTVVVFFVSSPSQRAPHSGASTFDKTSPSRGKKRTGDCGLCEELCFPPAALKLRPFCVLAYSLSLRFFFIAIEAAARSPARLI